MPSQKDHSSTLSKMLCKQNSTSCHKPFSGLHCSWRWQTFKNSLPAFPAFQESQRAAEPQLCNSLPARSYCSPTPLFAPENASQVGKIHSDELFCHLPQKTVPINSPTCWLAPGANSMPSHLTSQEVLTSLTCSQISSTLGHPRQSTTDETAQMVLSPVWRWETCSYVQISLFY